jgi:DNA-binding response OmpR family regulator
MTIAILSPTLSLAHRLSESLDAQGYRVRCLPVVEMAIPYVRTSPPALLVIDLGAGGIPTIEAIRNAAPTLPIFALTRIESEPELCAAYEAIVDDYQCIDTSPAEIVARVRAILRRVNMTPTTPQLPAIVYQSETLTVRGDRPAMDVGGVEVHLSKASWATVLALAASPEPISIRNLARRFRRDPTPHGLVAIYVRLNFLRDQIERATGRRDVIETTATGYRLVGA